MVAGPRFEPTVDECIRILATAMKAGHATLMAPWRRRTGCPGTGSRWFPSNWRCKAGSSALPQQASWADQAEFPCFTSDGRRPNFRWNLVLKWDELLKPTR